MARKRKKIKPTSVILSKAKRLACQHMPYLAALLYTARTIECPKIGTMAVDAAGRLYINPKFVQTLSVKNCAFILLHEMLHIVLSHAKRRAARVPNPTRKDCDLWNIAADISVNGILQRDVRDLTPEFGTFLHQFQHVAGMRAGLTTEQYYELLLEDSKKQPPQPPSNPQPPSDEDEDGEGSSQDGDESDDTEGDDSSSGGQSDEQDDESDEDSESGGSGDADDEDIEDDDEFGGDDESESTNDEPSDEDGDSQDGADGDDEQSDQPLEPTHSGSNSDGMPRDYEPDLNIAEAIGQEGKLAEVEEAIKAHESSGIGTAPGELKQSLDVRLRPQPDPFDTLSALVSKSVSSPIGMPIATFRRLSRRQQSDMPRRRGEQHFSPECVVVVDTSGSMECSDYKDRAIVAVAQGLKRVHRPRIITCDAAIHGDERVQSMKKFKWEGGGGTDMVMPIMHAESEYQPDAIVVITDGGTMWPAKKTRARLVVALVAPPMYGNPPSWAKVVACYEERRGHAG